ncbi:MAG: GNAT family N-acetyltransferase [Deltaproteobacteria bacterium]|nr:GNAT family N-acetyltransferase [Deltaproteobacteria bacterium]
MLENAGADTDRAPEPTASSAVHFRPFDLKDKEEAINLLSIGRPDGYRALKARLFDWQFLANPHQDGRPPFVVGELDGRIVALNGFMPARVRYHGKPVEACWSCDTYVSGEHRGKGIGKQLIAQVTKSAPLMLGYGISDMSDPIFEKFQWTKHSDIELVFCHLAETGLRGKIKNAVSRVAALRSVRLHGADYDVIETASPEFVSQVDELWARSADGYLSTVARDGAYVRWKYFEHPFYRYTAYAMRSGADLKATLIVRHDPVEAVIVDYVGPASDEDAIASLAVEVARDAADRDTTRIKCESTHKPLISALKRVGFIGSPYASRFRVRDNSEDVDALAGWLLMPGDSDGDLLVSTTLETEARVAGSSEVA